MAKKKRKKKDRLPDVLKVSLSDVLDELIPFKKNELSLEILTEFQEISDSVYDLVMNPSYKTRFVQHCQKYDNEYATFGIGELDFNDPKMIPYLYVLLAGVHDWMNPSFPIYAGIKPKFLCDIAGNIIYIVQDEPRFFKNALKRVKTDLGADKPKDETATDKSGEQKPEETLIQSKKTVKKWKMPRGYIGSQDIINSKIRELRERLNLPAQQDKEEYKIPRSTLEYWQSKDNVVGGELEGNIKKDFSTTEVYYPNKWLKKRILKYKPRPRNS